MRNFFRRIPWKGILCFILLGAIAVGAVVGIGSAVTDKTKPISSLKFERGSIDNSGVFVKSDSSIYTADYIECQGLHIEPDFDATGTYQVFYYDMNKHFISATEAFKVSEKPVYDKGKTIELAKYCKIVITPETPKDDNGYIDEDYKIKFYEVASIAGKFNITVNKKQNYSAKNLFVADDNYVNKSILFDSVSFTYTIVDNLGYSTSGAIDVTGMEQFKFVYDAACDTGVYTWILLDANGTPMACENEMGIMKDTIYTLPAGSASMLVTYKTGCEFGFYKVN